MLISGSKSLFWLMSHKIYLKNSKYRATLMYTHCALRRCSKILWFYLFVLFMITYQLFNFLGSPLSSFSSQFPRTYDGYGSNDCSWTQQSQGRQQANIHSETNDNDCRQNVRGTCWTGQSGVWQHSSAKTFRTGKVSQFQISPKICSSTQIQSLFLIAW